MKTVRPALHPENWSKLQNFLLFGLLLAVALWLRIRNLGDLSLMGDEGIEALAVRGILEHGVPKVDSGLIYIRWPLYLYMQAAFAHLFELNAFWLRLPSVIWGVATIIPAYILGRDLFNRPIGLLTALILVFSAWEIEISRYARGYTAFQFFFLISLICFYRGFMLDKNKYKVWFLVASAFALLTHALSDLLIVLFLIPLFSSDLTWSRKFRFSLWGVGLGGLILVRRQIAGLKLPGGSGLSWPSGDEATTGIIEQIRSQLGLPALNLPDMSYFSNTVDQEPALIVLLLLIGCVATIFLSYQLFQGQSGSKVALGILIVWSSFWYQFLLAFLIVMFYVLIHVNSLRDLRDSALMSSVGAAFICFVGWSVVLIGSDRLTLPEVPLTLFGFPNLYSYFFSWLVDGWTVMTIFLLIGSIMLFIRLVKDRGDHAALFLLGALYAVALIASLFDAYHASRYIFHLYPLVVIIFAMVAVKGGSFVLNRYRFSTTLSRKWVVSLGVLTILLASQDANPLRGLNIGDRTYQSAVDPVRSVMSWRFYAGFHQDFEGPSLFVKERLAGQDKVVAVGIGYMASMYHYYVSRTDYYLTPADDPDVSTLVNEQGEHIQYITGSNVISGVANLEALVQNHNGTVWLLGDRRMLREDNSRYSKEMKEYLRSLVQGEDYLGRDGITFAVGIQ